MVLFPFRSAILNKPSNANLHFAYHPRFKSLRELLRHSCILFQLNMSEASDLHTVHEAISDVGDAYDEKLGYNDTTSMIIPLDGGREAWFTIAGAWMVTFCTFGYVNAFGVYQDYYTREFLAERSASDIRYCSLIPFHMADVMSRVPNSWIGSFQLFMLYAPGIFVGRAFDAGYFHHVMISGSVLYVSSMFVLSLTQLGQYYQVFLCQSLGMGIGQGMLFLPALTIVGHHFRRLRSLAMGIVITGASGGGIVFPIMLNRLGQRMPFPNAIRATCGVVVGLLFIANCIMRTRLLPKRQRPPLLTPDIHAIVRDTTYLISIAGAVLVCLGLFFPYFYMQLYAVKMGVDPNLAFHILAILNAGSVVGRLLPTFLADRLGVYNIILTTLYSSAVLLFTIFRIDTSAGIVVMTSLYGFMSGAYVSLVPSLLSQLSTHSGEIGIRMGFAFSIVGVAMLVGNPIIGALLGHNSNYQWSRAIVFSGICVTSGAIFMTISRHMFVKRKGGNQLV